MYNIKFFENFSTKEEVKSKEYLLKKIEEISKKIKSSRTTKEKVTDIKNWNIY